MKCKKCGKEMTNVEKGDFTCIADVWSCDCGYVNSGCYRCAIDGVGVASTELCKKHRDESLIVVNGGMSIKINDPKYKCPKCNVETTEYQNPGILKSSVHGKKEVFCLKCYMDWVADNVPEMEGMV